MNEKEWGVRYPDGEVESAGILGENRARMLARKFDGEVVHLDEVAQDALREDR